jgi:glycosyltransferase involved in cell wall biosynthesis
MTTPSVDVIIPVHTAERPIARAVASVLTGTVAAVRVNVVCHNIDAEAIAESLGSWAEDARVRLLSLHDGLSSPAGPINVGLDAATADFTALLDSDDTYEPGAVDAWLEVQTRDRADVVIPMFKYADGSSTRTPPIRPFRSKNLDGVRDRLAYRTRQHGLVSRHRFPTLRMTPGLRSGEDVIQGATIWYSSARISFARSLPAYRIHEDGGERTSVSVKPAAESLLFLDAVLDPSFTDGLTVGQRESFAIKLLKTHIMDVLAVALETNAISDLVQIADAIQRVCNLSPGVLDIMSRRDTAILNGVTAGANANALSDQLAIRTEYLRIDNVLTSLPIRVLSSQAPLRFLAATLLSP